MFAGYFGKVDDGLRAGVHAQHGVVGSLVCLRIVVSGNEGVMVLSPGEYGSPVREIVRNDGKAIAPSFHNGFHVM